MRRKVATSVPAPFLWFEIADLKRKDFVATAILDDTTVLGPRLAIVVGDQFKALAPLVDYLCAALDLEF